MTKKEIRLLIDCVEEQFKRSLELEKFINEKYKIFNDSKFGEERFMLRSVKKKLLINLKEVEDD